MDFWQKTDGYKNLLGSTVALGEAMKTWQKTDGYKNLLGNFAVLNENLSSWQKTDGYKNLLGSTVTLGEAMKTWQKTDGYKSLLGNFAVFSEKLSSWQKTDGYKNLLGSTGALNAMSFPIFKYFEDHPLTEEDWVQAAEHLAGNHDDTFAIPAQQGDSLASYLLLFLFLLFATALTTSYSSEKQFPTAVVLNSIAVLFGTGAGIC
ncbi:hypothetical protein FACS1894206_09920 [Deltaproteobacteria bacterium]|nr:hypothetical protein FACS1894206_09920 [Deltaproteobacteria bacterium]